ncbi:MmgE/PrpD family protein [Biformimicrobium ophioploci]|uniref:MmgE/PrpD family protein n=1 Tax=Biformimicrobium ophioploci TaxID=3036711 RepID=A0ABQ6LW32_9GAMM|nr:MmgE/PrpD family protein [Microbulbifer sp. NKW57]GMG86290.1 hypothetical protein MNKW57_06110 [Microbulbifer sp. NKW57]
MSDFEARLVAHVAGTQFEDLDTAAVEACKNFVLDSFGVGLSGSRMGMAPRLLRRMRDWGAAPQNAGATAWGHGTRLPVPAAAMLNAFQIHNQEFDCVHEPAVVHPMAVILSALFADAEARRASGRDLLLSVVLAVDVATVLGMSASTPMRFFRPGTAGCIGAAAGLARLRGYDEDGIREAMSIAYSQTGGTMQAHTEGAAVLPMQVAFNARNAITAVDMVADGLCGPRDFLSGQFGYFSIMESAGNAPDAFALLGREWQISRVSHKPFPTGRAAHGTLDGLLQLRSVHGFAPEDIARVEVQAPPLVRRLVGRPPKAQMTPGYAKLCIGYVAATLLQRGDVRVEDFDPAALQDPARLQLAQRITMVAGSVDDPNALAPQQVSVFLQDGREHSLELPEILGSPERPLTREQQLRKFHRCVASARHPLPATAADAIVRQVESLESLDNVAYLSSLLCSGAAHELA